ncbi:MAG: hypothetical protein ABIG92_03545 [Candidatus Omnitrophota bacterium]
MKMSLLFIIIAIFAVPLSSFSENMNDADDGFEYETVIKNVNGIKFEVVEDRPIEKRDGIIAPMPLDKYVAMKCAMIRKDMKEMNTAVEDMKAKLDAQLEGRMDGLEERLKKIEDFIEKLKGSLKLIE